MCRLLIGGILLLEAGKKGGMSVRGESKGGKGGMREGAREGGAGWANTWVYFYWIDDDGWIWLGVGWSWVNSLRNGLDGAAVEYCIPRFNNKREIPLFFRRSISCSLVTHFSPG